MVDTYVSFSKENCMNSFTAFEDIPEIKDSQDPFKIDQRDIEELQKKASTSSVEKTKKSKRKNNNNNTTSDSTKTTSATPTVQCDICSVPISGPIVFDSHMNGKKHQTQLKTMLNKNPQYKAPTYDELCARKQEPAVVNNESEKSDVTLSELNANETPVEPLVIQPKTLNCNMCNISCNSQQMFENHVSGKKHQAKMKLNNSTNPTSTRVIPDNNPSSSNYCDACSIQLNSESDLTDHLAQKQHQMRVKDAECCAKEGAAMDINFENYKIPISDAEKDSFEYQCVPCVKKFRNKVQLIEHLKSTLHNRISNRSSHQSPSKPPSRGKTQAKRGSILQNDTITRDQSSTSFSSSTRSTGKSRPYRSQPYPRSHTYEPYNHDINSPTSQNIFGAFDPNNEMAYSLVNNTNNYYPATKRPIPYEQYSNEYDAFFPKRTRLYNDTSDNSKEFYPTEADYYSPATSSNYPPSTGSNYPPSTSSSYPPPSSSSYPPPSSSSHYPPPASSNYPWNDDNNSYTSPVDDYNDQPAAAGLSWPYSTEPHFDPPQYSAPPSAYINPIHYSSNQPPLPSYEPPPPLPNYPPPSSYTRAQSSSFHANTGNQGTKSYYPNSFGQ
ncbi:unnamed protein product [Rotaria magnacalcarata]|uniref:C2H2-type domain-containing protein n=3 Tax=Rotaria magnacalcarata TaxID=392030 RepID=A0A816PY26_9BILA|nr:unnamed protein product [Rotaria magnacalcarata]CAF3913172.1 unnamed protein product [Rotaria magnacalcarata]